MKGKKIAGIILVVVGGIILIVFALADFIGIGNPAAFGRVQIGGVIGGVVILAVGLFLMLKK